MSRQYTIDDTDDLIRLRTAWETVAGRLGAEIQAPILQRFVAPLEAVGFDGDVVKISAPGTFVAEWVRTRYLGVIQSYLSDELGQSITIQLVASPRDRAEEAPVPPTPVSVRASSEKNDFRPHDKFRFESYVIGQSNRLAHAGAKAVASTPGQKYNPLFIYGPSGLGKTHLLHSIAHELLANDPGVKLVYTSAQSFTEEFIAAVQSNRVDAFRRQNRQVDVWLVDDIQFIAGKDRTQEEIFYTFNHLTSSARQVVLCSDRPPRDLSLMDERLRSRFESGLVADVQMPDTETRCAIILSKADQEGIDLPTEIAIYLAETVPGNIRVLEGALTRLVALSSVEDRPLDMELAKHLAENYVRTDVAAKPNFNQIVSQVSRHFNISEEEIKGISRRAPIVHARHVAVWLMREITGDSWKHIGTLFGDRDHTSMMHAYHKITEQMHHDKEVRVSVKGLMKVLGDR